MTKYLILALSGIALLYSGWLATGLLSGYSDLKRYKEDLAEIHKVNYGLFNLQIWKKEALRVFENRIGEFEISPSAYRQVEKELEKYLHGINREYLESGKIFENIFAEAEKSEKVNKVFLKLVKDNAVPQIQKLDIPRFIPGMAVQLAKELKKQEPQLRDVMRAELIKILDKADMDSYVDPVAFLIYEAVTDFVFDGPTKAVAVFFWAASQFAILSAGLLWFGSYGDQAARVLSEKLPDC